MQGLLGVFTGVGCHPQQAGVSTTDPSPMSPRDVARLTSYTQQQNPGILHQVRVHGGPLGSTEAKVAVAGSVALAAKQILGGCGFGGIKV